MTFGCPIHDQMTHILRYHAEIGKMPVVLDPCPWPRLACPWPWPRLMCSWPWPQKNFKVLGLDLKVLRLNATLLAIMAGKRTSKRSFVN